MKQCQKQKDYTWIIFKLSRWANNPQDPEHRYVEQVLNAVNLYDGLLDKGFSIVMGDFNSNTIWDWKNRVGNHSAVVE